MTAEHRVAYDIVRPGVYTATCRCGKTRESRNGPALTYWGREHVLRAWEKAHVA